MKKKLLFGACLLSMVMLAVFFTVRFYRQRVMFVDFDVSMKAEQYTDQLKTPIEQHIYTCFKKIFYQHDPRRVLYHKILLIPKKIHQIWLGSPLPEEYAHYAQTWKKYHPSWEYKLWTDADLATYPLKNRDLYKASSNYGEKADIARYEILYNEGGVYVDTDYECFKSLDVLHHCYEFYVGIQPLDTSTVQLGIGIIGSRAHHPLLRRAIEELAPQSKKTAQIIAKTGPLFFTKIFCETAPQLSGPLIAFPASYFYPRGYYQRKEEKNNWMRPESFAVHHWAGSWLKQEAFVHISG